MAQLGISLALTLCELKAVSFVKSQCIYKFDCFPMMINKEASTRASSFSGLTTTESRVNIWKQSKINLSTK